jgi:GNAT superfamily N-acetyltransferase
MGDWPDAQELQLVHYRCLQRMYFDSLQAVSGGSLLFSNHVGDSYYNYFGATALTTPDDIRSCDQAFAARDRTPAAYVGPQVQAETIDSLTKDGYTRWATDAWLGIDLSADFDISLPSTIVCDYLKPEGEVAYLDAFRDSYSGASGEDAYGDLDEGYTQALGQALPESKINGYERRFLQAVEGNRVVGVVSLILAADLAGCYGLGVVPDQRHRGLGRALMERIANDARSSGAERLFLQTESGSAVEEWYQHLGYRPLFDATYLKKPGS